MKSVMMMDLQESNSNNILKEENTQHQLDVLQKDNEHLKEKLLTMEKEVFRVYLWMQNKVFL